MIIYEELANNMAVLLTILAGLYYINKWRKSK